MQSLVFLTYFFQTILKKTFGGRPGKRKVKTILSHFGSLKASFGRYPASFRFIECQILLEALVT